MTTTPPFDPAEFFSLAQKLATAPTDEARLRTAVSRAYYAILLATRNRLSITATEGVHGLTIREAKQRYRPYGDQLDAFRRLRSRADYELGNEDPTQRDWGANWGRAETLAKRLFGQVSTLPRTPPPRRPGT